MNKFAQDIEDKVAYLFDKFKLLPSIDEENRKRFTFLAQPRDGDSIQKIQNTLCHLKSGLEIEDSHAVKSGHKFSIGENTVSIYYVSSGDNFDFFYEISSHGINSILGKVTKNFNLKLTQEGLLYEETLGIANHQSKVGDFLVTNDTRELFGFLKLDYDRFKEGFTSKNDLFAFLASCPYLNPKKFTEPKKEHKLPIYQEFQAYLILNPIMEPHQKPTYDDVHNYFSKIDFHANVERLKLKEKRKREAVEKFSGKVILEHYPDFDKKKIGTSMGYFKYSFESVENFRDFLCENSTEVVMKKFKETVQF
jgi:hypothetical protein